MRRKAVPPPPPPPKPRAHGPKSYWWDVIVKRSRAVERRRRERESREEGGGRPGGTRVRPPRVRRWRTRDRGGGSLVQKMISFHEGTAPGKGRSGRDSVQRTRGRKRKKPDDRWDMEAVDSPWRMKRRVWYGTGPRACSHQPALPTGEAQHQVDKSNSGSGGLEDVYSTGEACDRDSEEGCSGGHSPATGPPAQRGQTTDSSGADLVQDEARALAAEEV